MRKSLGKQNPKREDNNISKPSPAEVTRRPYIYIFSLEELII